MAFWDFAVVGANLFGVRKGDLRGGEIARIWPGFVTRGPKVKIAASAGLGDGQPFIVHEAGAPIEVMIELADGLELFRLYLPGGETRKNIEGSETVTTKAGPFESA